MKNFRRPAFIIYKEPNEEKVSSVLTEIYSKHLDNKPQVKRGHQTLSVITTIIKGYKVVTIYNVFTAYRFYDNFLLEVSKEFNDLDKIGLLIGHVCSDGMLWCDYHSLHPKEVFK